MHTTSGGKDKIPFEINRKTYDSVIHEMEDIVDKANMETGDKYKVLKALNQKLK